MSAAKLLTLIQIQTCRKAILVAVRSVCMDCDSASLYGLRFGQFVWIGIRSICMNCGSISLYGLRFGQFEWIAIQSVRMDRGSVSLYALQQFQ